eukprot:7616380-Alexandrium_andersonii.AAC.1
MVKGNGQGRIPTSVGSSPPWIGSGPPQIGSSPLRRGCSPPPPVDRWQPLHRCVAARPPCGGYKLGYKWSEGAVAPHSQPCSSMSLYIVHNEVFARQDSE